MAAVVIDTDDFVELLKAAQVTTFTGKDDPVMRCVYLDTTRTDATAGSEETLVAFSGDRSVWGQYSCPAEGELESPLVIDIAANKWIISSVTAAKKNMQELEGKNAECRVNLSLTGTASTGQRLVVQTTTDGIRGDKDIEAIIPLETEPWPVTTAEQYLSGKHFNVAGSDVDDLPDGKVMGFDSSATTVMDKISGVIKDNVMQYPTGHSAGRRILTCGPRWRGSVPGYSFTPEQAEEPTVEFISIDRGDSEDTGEDVAE